jgi:hypothetical protein
MRRAFGAALAISLALTATIVLAPSGGSSSARGLRAEKWSTRLPFKPVVRGSRLSPVSRPARELAHTSRATRTYRRVVPTTSPRQAQGPAPAATVEFEGINQAQGGGAYPPDVNGDVGPDHYVQTTNFGSFAVWNKQGTQVLAPTNMGLLWPVGDPCRDLGRGDPVVQYDQFAKRWLLTQFAFARDAANKRVPPFYECIAITTSPDPTGKYFAYSFLIDNELFPDYPHFGVWPDGYYMSVHLFDAADKFTAMGIIAFDRENMLIGEAAREIQFFTNPDYFGLLPADAQGLTPPPSNAPNYMATFPLSGRNELRLYGFYANWITPLDSYIGGPTILPTQAFDPSVCNASGCIPQPGTPTKLDPNDFKINYPLVYRNFQDHHMLAVNHVVDADGTEHAGIRWYEIRRPGPLASIHQQGTHSPDGLHRWMAGMNVDGAGNFALGYSLGGASTFPSIAYAARLAADPLGTLPLEERVLLQGAGSQTGTFRWGDYVSMSIDPVDDCTFWFTNQYYSQTSDDDWQTRVFAFKLPACPAPSPGPTPSPNPSASPAPSPSPSPTPTQSPSPSPPAPPTPEPSPPPGFDTTPPQLTDVFDSPDPFRPLRGQVVDIFWTLSEAAQVTIDIHNSVDRYIVTLASEPLDPGQWYIPWDGGNRFGSLVGRGTYRYIIRATDAAGNTGEATGTATLRRPRRRF